MEQIINGLKYDTEKAARVASNEYWDGHNWDRDGRNTYLYKTPNGRKQYYEDLPEHEMSYAEAFGEAPEEA